MQVFIATQDYAILKEPVLGMKPNDAIHFHALYRDQEDGELTCESAGLPFELKHSPIAEAYTSLYDRELEHSRNIGRGAR